MKTPWKLWDSRWSDGRWWFRIRGYGLSCKNIKKYPLIFSERNGYVIGMIIFIWRINLLIGGD